MGSAVIVQLYDISKFFDRESLRDGLNSIFQYGVTGKLYRLLYHLNKDTRISVKNAIGCSDPIITGENIGQGTQEGAIISAANIDFTVNKYFKTSADELSYGNINLQPLLFQDDITRISTSIKSAQSGNIRMEWAMESKLLDFNLDKSSLMIIGPKNRKNELLKELDDNPVLLCKQKMKIASKEKLLGDIISSNGLADSAKATVDNRKWKVISSIVEIRAVVEDYRSNLLGGIVTGLEIWELSVIPFLLYNSETWTDLSKETLNTLNDLQLKFYRTILSVPRTCPTPALLWETGGWLMEHRIALRKLLFFHHLIHLPKQSLAYQIANVQHTLGYPGLVGECNILLELYGITVRPEELSKVHWRKLCKKMILNKNKIDILEKAKKYKKISYDEMKKESFEVKSYLKDLSLSDAKLKFAIRTKMVRTIQANFKGEQQYKSNNWKCVGCGKLDTQEHVLGCSAYKHLREGRCLDNDKELVRYFRSVISMRESQ